MQQRKNSNIFIDFFWGRYFVLSYSTILFGISVLRLLYSVWFLVPSAILGVLSFIGWNDFSQKKHGVLANYPVLGRFRWRNTLRFVALNGIARRRTETADWGRAGPTGALIHIFRSLRHGERGGPRSNAILALRSAGRRSRPFV